MEATMAGSHHPVELMKGEKKAKKPRPINISAETEWEIQIRKSESSESLSPFLSD